MRRLNFKIEFNTSGSDVVRVCYRFRRPMGEEARGNLMLEEQGSGVWFGFLTLDCNVNNIKYGYEIIRNGELVRSEWGAMPHSVDFGDECSSWMVYDKWLDSPFCNYMQTGLFKKFYQTTKQVTNYD